MDRVAELIKTEDHAQAFTKNLFTEITRTRETIIRFSKVRTALTDTPEKQLNKLFAYYIERNFVNK